MQLFAGLRWSLARSHPNPAPARVKAGLAANRELLGLYWDIGRLILDRQRREGWGAKVIARLALGLQQAFPGQGFLPANLLFMRAFADAWSKALIALQPVGQLPVPLDLARGIQQSSGVMSAA